MILPCWGETALVKKRLPSRKCVYFVLKEGSLLGVGSFHWTSSWASESCRIVDMLILYLSWTSKKCTLTVPSSQFIVFLGFLRIFQTENHWRAAIFLVCQAWTQKLSGHFCHEPNLAQETKPEVGVFWCQNWCFFLMVLFSMPGAVPQFFWVSFVWQGGYNNSKKGEQKHEKKAFPAALTSQHWTQPLVEGLYDLDPTVGWHWVQHLSLTECKKACEARFFVVKIRLHQVPIGFLRFSCKIEVYEVCCTRSLCVVKR